MKAVSVAMFIGLVLSQVASAISTEDANKFVNKYETMTQRLMGFMNCVSRALTGEDAISAAEGDNLSKLAIPGGEKATLVGCFERAGFKVNKGLAKLLSFGSSETDTENTEIPDVTAEEIQAIIPTQQEKIPDRAVAPNRTPTEAVAPGRPATTPGRRAPTSQKPKTRWSPHAKSYGQ